MLVLVALVSHAAARSKAVQSLQHPVLDSTTVRSFTVYSDPVALRYGEVFMHNDTEDVDAFNRPLPSEVVHRYSDARRAMAVREVKLDIVRYVGGKEVSVPLSDVYNHHAKISIGESHDEGSWGNRNQNHFVDVIYIGRQK